MPEIMGGGAALADLDADGTLDAYLVQSAGANRLFLNRGDGRFDEATAGSGAGDEGYGMGVATGDVDGDGLVDLFVTNVGPDVLLRNLGGGRFEDVSDGFGSMPDEWSSSAAFMDFDLDGDLDLFVTTYLGWSEATEIDCYSDAGVLDYCSPQSYDAPLPDRLYRNDGLVGAGSSSVRGVVRFVDVSESLGISESAGTGLGVTVADFDRDGRQEIFVANDGMPDHLWVWADPSGSGEGRFEERAALAGCAVDFDGTPKAGMGVVCGDFDHDGDEDLLVGNLARESDSFFRNDGGQFVDTTARVGLGAASRGFTRFGMAWVDFDNDGRADLYQANGRVALPGLTRGQADPYAEANLLFWGRSTGFDEASPRGGTALRPDRGPEDQGGLDRTSRGVASGDIDGDGGIDLLVVERDAPASLLRNVVADRGKWLQLDVRDRRGAPALGAEAHFRIAGVDRMQVVRTASSYQSATSPRLHVGLGEEPGITDLRIRWTDGVVTKHGDFAAGARHRIDRAGAVEPGS